eukprot:746849-Hanusia_phi.AAC.6
MNSQDRSLSLFHFHRTHGQKLKHVASRHDLLIALPSERVGRLGFISLSLSVSRSAIGLPVLRARPLSRLRGKRRAVEIFKSLLVAVTAVTGGGGGAGAGGGAGGGGG